MFASETCSCPSPDILVLWAVYGDGPDARPTAFVRCPERASQLANQAAKDGVAAQVKKRSAFFCHGRTYLMDEVGQIKLEQLREEGG